MTLGEENRIMGDAAAELATVRKQIGCLETKTEAYQRVLSQASRALRDNGDDGFPADSDWPSLSELSELRDELNAARTRGWQLKKRLQEWGVID